MSPSPFLLHSNTVKTDLQNSMQRQQTLHSEGSKVANFCQEKITSTGTVQVGGYHDYVTAAPSLPPSPPSPFLLPLPPCSLSCPSFLLLSAVAVDKKITTATRDLISQLSAMADKYEAEFDPNDPENYKQGLYEFMDECLREELGRVGEVMLGRLHEEARRLLIGEKVCCVLLSTLM